MRAFCAYWEKHSSHILLAFQLGCLALAWLCLLFSLSYLNRLSVGVPIKEMGDVCKFWLNPIGAATLQQCEGFSQNKAITIALLISSTGSTVMLIIIAGYDILFYSSDSDEDT